MSLVRANYQVASFDNASLYTPGSRVQSSAGLEERLSCGNLMFNDVPQFLHLRDILRKVNDNVVQNPVLILLCTLPSYRNSSWSTRVQANAFLNQNRSVHLPTGLTASLPSIELSLLNQFIPVTRAARLLSGWRDNTRNASTDICNIQA